MPCRLCSPTLTDEVQVSVHVAAQHAMVNCDFLLNIITMRCRLRKPPRSRASPQTHSTALRCWRTLAFSLCQVAILDSLCVMGMSQTHMAEWRVTLRVSGKELILWSRSEGLTIDTYPEISVMVLRNNLMLYEPS